MPYNRARPAYNRTRFPTPSHRKVIPATATTTSTPRTTTEIVEYYYVTLDEDHDELVKRIESVKKRMAYFKNGKNELMYEEKKTFLEYLEKLIKKKRIGKGS